MNKELKTIPWEIKADVNKREFEGYASTFHNRDLVGDIVQPGAFSKTINERRDQIKVLYNHREPLGYPLHMEEDSKGLYVKAHISETSLGNDVLTLMKDGVIDRMSIGYDIIKDEYRSEGGRTDRLLKELKLFEFSPVIFPANEMASVTGVKAAMTHDEILNMLDGLHMAEMLKSANPDRVRASLNLLEEKIHETYRVIEPGDNPTQKNTSQQDPPEWQSILDEIKSYSRAHSN